MIKKWNFLLSLLVVGTVGLLSACGGENDPVLREINERLDVDIDEFDVSLRNIQPNDKIKIRWESSGAVLFDAHVYLSEDSRPSSDDFRVISEDCSPDSGDHCEAGRQVVFDCLYRSDNSFDCEEDDEVISTNDLTPFLDTIPKTAFIILELCNDGDCESRALEVTFF